MRFPSALVFLIAVAIAAKAQQVPRVPQTPHSPETILRISTNLVLVDVVALSSQGGRPESRLSKDDLQVFDDGHPVSIKTFDVGTGARPLALWFIVQCKMPGWEAEGSGLFTGEISLFEPALKDLEKQDTVAVAHWCDNGDSRLDMMPTSDVAQATSSLEQVLAAAPAGEFKHDRTGELALQKTLQLIVDATRSLPRDTLPLVVFLYGDYSAMPRGEADAVVDKLLQTSAIAYGLADSRSPKIRSRSWAGGEQGAIAGYIATSTGGRYFRAATHDYAGSLKKILEQLHFRYELGFQPASLDSRRHKLTVKLVGKAKKRFKGVQLTYRTAYVPVPHQPE